MHFSTCEDTIIHFTFYTFYILHLLTGDLNADQSTSEGGKRNLFSQSNGLTMHIKTPTRMTEQTVTLLEQVFPIMFRVQCFWPL